MRQRQLREDLDHPSIGEEVLDALNINKAGGKNELTPELVKHVSMVFGEHVLYLFKSVWEEGSAVLVVIP